MDDEYFSEAMKLVVLRAQSGSAKTLDSEAWVIYQMTRAAIRAEWAAARMGLYPPSPKEPTTR